MSGQVWGLLGVMASVLGSILVARLSARAQNKKAVADADVSSGQLALEIAKRAESRAIRAEDRIGVLERWRRAVLRWGAIHEEWDREVEAHIKKVDPDGWPPGLPPRHPMPTVPDDE